MPRRKSVIVRLCIDGNTRPEGKIKSESREVEKSNIIVKGSLVNVPPVANLNCYSEGD